MGGGYLNNFKGIALSLGVSESSPWDLDIANMGIKVIEYDGSIEKCPYDHENIIFRKKYIGKQNDENTITLEQVIKDNKLEITQDNILQCDIENCEWEMLENIDFSILNQYFSQVIFEFHGCNPEEESGVALRTEILKKLNQYFIPIHLHFNNHGKIFYSNQLFFSTTLEVTYLRKSMLNFDSFKYRNNGVILNYDYPIWPSNPEIPIRFNF